MRDAPVFQEADHRGEPDRGAGRVDGVQALFFGGRDALEDENEGPAGRANIDRLVARVEHQDGFLASPPESVVAFCPRRTYDKPTSVRVWSLPLAAGTFWKKRAASSTVISSTSWMFLPR